MKPVKVLLTAAAGLLLCFGAAQATSAGVITVQSDPLYKTSPSGNQLSGGDWFLTNNPDTLENGVPSGYAWVGLVKFDLSKVQIPAGERIKSAELLLSIKKGDGKVTSNGHIQFHQIIGDGVKAWNGTTTPTWTTVGQYYDSKVVGELKGFDEAAHYSQTISIPIDSDLVQGWIGGSIPNGGLEAWNLSSDGKAINTGFPPSGWDTAARLKITTAPIPEPATMSLLIGGGLLMMRHRR